MRSSREVDPRSARLVGVATAVGLVCSVAIVAGLFWLTGADEGSSPPTIVLVGLAAAFTLGIASSVVVLILLLRIRSDRRRAGSDQHQVEM